MHCLDIYLCIKSRKIFKCWPCWGSRPQCP